jgi:polygalacturonase
MRSVWDEDDVRKIVHRGPKCIALKNCKNVEVSGLGIYNVTDLAVYFAGCENVDVFGLKLRVYIDGISPDNSKNVRIYDCDVESGDDGIVFKSSYTLGRIDVCRNISVKNCRVKSRCSAIKFGTETNGGFYDITVEDVDVVDTRITAIAIESVDGAIIDGLHLKNIRIKNAGAPLFIHTGARMRGPEGVPVGHIRNVTLENVTAEGPYEPWEAIEWNYKTFVAGEKLQQPWNGGDQYTSNVCGLAESPLENITLRNVSLQVAGGISEWVADVPDNLGKYPEVWIYGKVLPAKGIFFRHVRGLNLQNVQIGAILPDAREDFMFDDVAGLVIE